MSGPPPPYSVDGDPYHWQNHELVEFVRHLRPDQGQALANAVAEIFGACADGASWDLDEDEAEGRDPGEDEEALYSELGPELLARSLIAQQMDLIQQRLEDDMDDGFLCDTPEAGGAYQCDLAQGHSGDHSEDSHSWTNNEDGALYGLPGAVRFIDFCGAPMAGLVDDEVVALCVLQVGHQGDHGWVTRKEAPPALAAERAPWELRPLELIPEEEALIARLLQRERDAKRNEDERAEAALALYKAGFR